jgi:hypothetical protein
MSNQEKQVEEQEEILQQPEEEALNGGAEIIDPTKGEEEGAGLGCNCVC